MALFAANDAQFELVSVYRQDVLVALRRHAFVQTVQLEVAFGGGSLLSSDAFLPSILHSLSFKLLVSGFLKFSDLFVKEISNSFCKGMTRAPRS